MSDKKPSDRAMMAAETINGSYVSGRDARQRTVDYALIIDREMGVEELREALWKIADGEYNTVAANPDCWPCIIAKKALGFKWENGVLIHKPIRPKKALREAGE